MMCSPCRKQDLLQAQSVSSMIRIRVCLQAYRKCRSMNAPLGAGADVGDMSISLRSIHPIVRPK